MQGVPRTREGESIKHGEFARVLMACNRVPFEGEVAVEGVAFVSRGSAELHKGAKTEENDSGTRSQHMLQSGPKWRVGCELFDTALYLATTCTVCVGGNEKTRPAVSIVYI